MQQNPHLDMHYKAGFHGELFIGWKVKVGRKWGHPDSLNTVIVGRQGHICLSTRLWTHTYLNLQWNLCNQDLCIKEASLFSACTPVHYA